MLTKIMRLWCIIAITPGLTLTSSLHTFGDEPDGTSKPDNRSLASNEFVRGVPINHLIFVPALTCIAPPSSRFIDSIGITIVPIKSGEFAMGSTDEQIALVLKQYPELKTAFLDEQPRHRVRITKLQGLSAHEITVGQFRCFVEDEGYKTEPESDGIGGCGYNAEKRDHEFARKYTWRDPGFAQTDEHPVVNVTWNDAMAFCRWLSRKDGRTYRLPTEAEWEYSCRAGTNSLYSNGDDPKELARIGNTAEASLKAKVGEKYPEIHFYNNTPDGFAFTASVGHYLPNAWGLYDMHGNVWEWCLDNYDPEYYKGSPVDDPRGPVKVSPLGQVLRGGSWLLWGRDCRSASRDHASRSRRHHYVGFRVALSVDQL